MNKQIKEESKEEREKERREERRKRGGKKRRKYHTFPEFGVSHRDPSMSVQRKTTCYCWLHHYF